MWQPKEDTQAIGGKDDGEGYMGLEKPSDIPREIDHYTVVLAVDALKSCEDISNDGSSADTTNQGQVGPWLST